MRFPEISGNEVVRIFGTRISRLTVMVKGDPLKSCTEEFQELERFTIDYRNSPSVACLALSSVH